MTPRLAARSFPGGAYSAEELIAATEADPVVFVQHGAVDRTAVRPVALPRPRHVYMSYRIGDQIYWTRSKVLLNAGEITLTNGDIQIRARCGNRISETAMFPASDSEPDVVEFDRLVDDEPDLLASWGFAFPPLWLGSVAGASPGVTPPEPWDTAPLIPMGLPGWVGGSYPPGSS